MKNNSKKLTKVLIASGGTGGHLFPGIALAEAIEKIHPEAKVAFVGTARGLEAKLIPQTKWSLFLMKTSSFKDQRGLKRLLVFLTMPMALFQALRILLKVRPSMVLGVGGYAAGPITLMAAFMLIPTAIVEPNATPGLTNKILGYFVRKVFVAFPEVLAQFSAKKAVLSGNPVRAKLNNSNISITKSDQFTVLCFGGSQGARRINSAVTSCLDSLGSYKKQIRFIHQVGRAENADLIREKYQTAGINAEVCSFIDDMSSAYAQADIIICRAGATSVAEIIALGKPAILVPYPHAADDHQRANADAVVKKGGAILMLDAAFNGDRLAAEIRSFMQEPWRLEKMSAALQKIYKPNAANEIVRICWEMINKKSEPVAHSF